MCVGDISREGKPGCHRRATKVVVGLVVIDPATTTGAVGLATVCERHLGAMIDFLGEHDAPVVLPIRALPGLREELGDGVYEMTA
jgi:hypothetical protein